MCRMLVTSMTAYIFSFELRHWFCLSESLILELTQLVLASRLRSASSDSRSDIQRMKNTHWGFFKFRTRQNTAAHGRVRAAGSDRGGARAATVKAYDLQDCQHSFFQAVEMLDEKKIALMFGSSGSWAAAALWAAPWQRRFT